MHDLGRNNAGKENDWRNMFFNLKKKKQFHSAREYMFFIKSIKVQLEAKSRQKELWLQRRSKFSLSINFSLYFL